MRRTATLLFDSATAGAMPGVRAVAGGERSLLFQTQDLALDMTVFESAGLQVVHGQLVSTATECGVPGVTIRLGEDAEPAVTDHFGQFSVGTVEPIDGALFLADGDDLALACQVPARGAPGATR